MRDAILLAHLAAGPRRLPDTPALRKLARRGLVELTEGHPDDYDVMARLTRAGEEAVRPPSRRATKLTLPE